MKALELQVKQVAQLETEVSELLKAHFKLRMLKASQQLNDHTQLGKTRRDIARVKTILAQKNRQDVK
jgi:large subunit ribosomal protein L29